MVDLMESEKFRNHQRKILETEVRRERDEDGCFFRLKDVARCFNDIRRQDHFLHRKSGYNEHGHYLYFYRSGVSGTVENDLPSS